MRDLEECGIGHRVVSAAKTVREWIEQPSRASASFWQALQHLGTPVIRAHPADPGLRRVTFVWRDPQAAAVYARLNRVTDKDRVPLGLFTPVPDTDIWLLTLDLPADLRCSYAIVAIAAEDQHLREGLGGRGAQLPARPDPLNPHRIDTGRPSAAVHQSLLRLDRAPAQPEWEFDQPGTPATGRRGDLSSAVSADPIAGRRRRLWRYRPPPDRRDGAGRGTGEPVLVVLTDAEIWFGALGLGAALDRGIASGRIPPTQVLGIENLDQADRTATLGGCPQLVDDLAHRVLPALRRQEEAIPGPGRTVLCGQSLGGLTALLAAHSAADAFGLVLPHSPSLWWRPGGAARPDRFGADEVPWIADRLAAIAPSGVRIRCAVGALEGVSVAQVCRLTDRLAGAGWDAGTAIYQGGHDWAWWRGALFDQLAAAFAPDPGLDRDTA